MLVIRLLLVLKVFSVIMFINFYFQEMSSKIYKNSSERGFLWPKKSLGQHFLRSQAVLKEIIGAGELNQKDVVVEIGPGQGFLTKALLVTVGQVVAIEKDEKLVAFLKKQIWLKKNRQKIILVTGDVLQFHWLQFFQEKKIESYKLVANIPYYITGQILRIFQEIEWRPEIAVFLVQKEVAERVCASAGQKSLLSIASEYFGQCQIVDYVGKENFFPVPKVDSAILKIVFKKAIHLPHQNLASRKAFFRLVKMGFASRRKTLFNNLKIAFAEELLKQAFLAIGLNWKVRAQELELKDWLALEKFFVN